MKRIMIGAAIAALATQAHAGGRLEQIDLGPSIGAGIVVADVVPIFWDKRCASINYTQNTVPATIDGLSIASVVAEQQASFNQWNQIPTSFIEMNITGTNATNALRRFNFVNELTWLTPAAGFLASSPSTSLIDESVFNVGDDIDGDFDSDVFDPVAAGRDTCFDADADGDVEFPAGTYAAGTILDNDVQYNNAFTWVTAPNNASTVDIQAVAVHEFGHSHSLSHSMMNQISDLDGTGSTMFPFIDTTDAVSEAGQRNLHTDDIAWSSFVYPEGSATSGIAALQAGDIPFSSGFDVLRGVVTQNGLGVLGASVQAIEMSTGRRLSEGYSGTSRLGVQLSNLGLLVLVPADGIVNGNYEIPIPKGVYDLNIEALDGAPAASNNISLTAQIGNIYGQLAFAEEFLSSEGLETNIEERPGHSVQVTTSSSDAGIRHNFVTNDDILLRNAGGFDFIGSGAVGGLTNAIITERFDRNAVLAILDAGGVLTTGLIHTATTDNSFVPRYKRAALVLGTRSANGLTANVEVANAIASEAPFIGQDNDLTPFFFGKKSNFTKKVRDALVENPGKDLFLVVEIDDNQIGPTGLDPLIAIDTGPSTGQSFLASSGGPFNVQTTRNWAIELRFKP